MSDELDTQAGPQEEKVDTTPEPTRAEPEFTDAQLEPELQPEPEPEPQPLSQEDIFKQAEERAFDRMASWSGRRDQVLFDKIGTLVDSKLRATTQSAPLVQEGGTDDFLENPDGWMAKKLSSVIPGIIQQEQSKRIEADQAFATDVVRHVGALMDNDALFEDKKFGAEVLKGMQSQFNSIDKNVSPAVGAQLLVNKAVADVYRKQRTAKVNPLDKNTGGAKPMELIKPPVARPASKGPSVKLSDEAEKLRKHYGYTHEQIGTILK